MSAARRCLSGVLAAVLVLVVIGAAACDASEPTRDASDPDSAFFDEWDILPPPPTAQEVLSAPAEHEADAVVTALIDAAARLKAADGGGAADLELVLSLRNDPREEVRWHVAEALRVIGSEDACKALAEISKSDASALVRDAATEGLGENQ